MKKLLLAVAALFAVVALNVGVAGATQVETPPSSLTGSGQCQTDGSFKITWVIQNTKGHTLKVTDSSDVTVVPVGTEVPKLSSANFYQTVDGTKAGSFKLDLKYIIKYGDDDEDEVETKDLTATVSLREACPQPAPVVAVAATPQVTVPVTKVNAGEGGARFAKLGALVGLSGSLAVLAFGVRRLAKNQ